MNLENLKKQKGDKSKYFYIKNLLDNNLISRPKPLSTQKNRFGAKTAPTESKLVKYKY